MVVKLWCSSIWIIASLRAWSVIVCNQVGVMEGEYKGFKIEKFDGRDYEFCWLQVVDILFTLDLHLVLAVCEPDGVHVDDWMVLTRKHLS